MSIKIGTITTHSALNYGAVLQAYALCEYLNEIGTQCEIIDYQPNYIADNYKLLRIPKNVKDLLLLLYKICNYGPIKRRIKYFEDFRRNVLKTSNDVITDKQILAKYVSKYNLVVCGSDQIWNPELHKFDEAYFMSMPEVNVPHISYAASFGQDNISDDTKDELKRRLQGYSTFACRENTAIKLLNELLNIDAALVLDPIFLLDFNIWCRLMKPLNIKEKYTLLYFLSNPGQSPYTIKEFSKKNGYTPISIGFSPRDVNYGIKNIYDLGPCEFLQAIQSAEVIMTNSFHMTAFAIIFEKNFYTCISKTEKSRNDRILTLLHSLGLENRVYTDDAASELDFSCPIDYDEVRIKISKMQNESKKYLKEALNFAK